MIHKRYYSPFESDVIVEPQRVIERPVPSPLRNDPPLRKLKCNTLPNKQHKEEFSPFGFLAEIKLDDVIIIGLILLLLFEEQEERDMPLIIGLGILLLIEFLEKD